MKILLKESQTKKLKKIIRENRFFILCNNSSITVEGYTKLKQDLLQLDLSYHKINNKLLKNAFKKSIFFNYMNIINGSVVLILFKNISNFNVLILLNILTKYKINILCFYFNNKVYSCQQLRNFYYLSYIKIIIVLKSALKTLLKRPCYTLVKKDL